MAEGAILQTNALPTAPERPAEIRLRRAPKPANFHEKESYT